MTIQKTSLKASPRIPGEQSVLFFRTTTLHCAALVEAEVQEVPFHLGMELRCATQQVRYLYVTGVEIAGHLLSFTLWLSSDRF